MRDATTTDLFCLDPAYSTTRLVTQEAPVFKNQPSDKFQSMLFLPPNPDRKGEGGLRTRGYFKQSLPDKPLITVITVVFNGAAYLEDTIKSVINQTYDNVEYVIVDGGSTDGSVGIIKKYEGLIDYWVSEKDGGIYDAMNKGVKVSTSDWVNLLNSGDVFNSILLLSGCVKYLCDKSLIFYSDTIFYRYYNNIKYYKRIKCDHNLKNIIHQSCIYNRRLHELYGYYLVKKKLSISDYIFFNQIENKYWCKLDLVISNYLVVVNVSNGLHHEIQKLSVDILFDNIAIYNFLVKIIKSYVRLSAIKLIKCIIPTSYYYEYYLTAIAKYKKVVDKLS